MMDADSRNTWRDLAVKYPEFVQWIVQRHGPLPEGPVDQEQLLDYLAEHLKEHGYVKPPVT